MSHKKNFAEASRRLDKVKRRDPKKYRKKEVAVNRVLRKQGLI